jgi:hypothetical protein
MSGSTPRYNPEKDDMVDGLREHYFRIARHSGATRQQQGRLADHFRYADLSVLIPQACLSRPLSEMMDRIAKGPEDVKNQLGPQMNSHERG